MRLLKTALTLALLLPSALHARGLQDTYMQKGGCFIRDYSTDHLAKHPDQLVRHISLAPVPLANPPGILLLNLTVNLRGSDYYYSSFAYCHGEGVGMQCDLEGDAGSFVLEPAKNGALRLTLTRDGVSFEGATAFVELSGTSGDDRQFLLPSVNADQCN